MGSLLLHVGHGKTGSSYIQSTLANSAGSLFEAGIYYPLPPNAEAAARGKTSSGNGWFLINRNMAKLKRPEGTDSVLLSSEFLFAHLIDQNNLREIRRLCEELSIARVRVLLFIRNPLEYVASSYQQSVKSEGYAGAIDDVALEMGMPQMVYRFLEAVQELEKLEVSIRNYSVVKDSLVATVAQWLGIEAAILTPPTVPRVNRSLSAGELYLQRELNAVLGSDAKALALALCDELPYVKSEEMHPSLAVQEQLRQAILPAMEAVNKVVEPQHHYQCDLGHPVLHTTDGHTFSEKQLAVIARVLGREIARSKQARPSDGRGATVAPNEGCKGPAAVG